MAKDGAHIAMSATATNNTPPAAPSADVDDVDITEAEVLAALGETAEAETPESAETPEQPEAVETPEASEEPEAPEQPEAPAAEEPAAPAAGPASDELAALKKRLDELTAQLAAAQTAPVAAPAATPTPVERPPLSATSAEVFENVTDAGELAAREISLSKLHAWALRNEDGGKLGDLDISRSDVLELKASTWEAIHQRIPARRAYLAEVARAEGEAVNAYPSLKDPASAESKAVDQFLTENPALRRLPNAKLIAADAAIGRLARTGKPKAGQPAAAPAPAPKTQPPRAPSSAARPGVLPPRTTPSASHLKSATERLSKGNGSVDDVASVIAASMS